MTPATPATPVTPVTPVNPPAHIEIGPYRYRVRVEAPGVWRGRLEDDQAGVTTHGSVDMAACDIWVSSEAAPAYQRATVLHEVLHVLLRAAGMPKFSKKTTEDDVIERLDASLLDTLRRNPDLVTYLLADDES